MEIAPEIPIVDYAKFQCKRRRLAFLRCISELVVTVVVSDARRYTHT